MDTKITREKFAHWLCGFVDGEGCFCLYRPKRKQNTTNKPYNITFSIKLRKDDYAILEEIKSYFGCGRIQFRKNTKKSKPQAVFVINKIDDLHDVVRPFFRTYPLRAKKQRDFKIWVHAVELFYEIQSRQYRTTVRGGKTKWNDEDHRKMHQLYLSLKKVRTYRDPVVKRILPLNEEQFEFVRKMLAKDQKNLELVKAPVASKLTGLCRQSIEKQAARGKIVKVSTGKRRNAFPKWQFRKDIFPGLYWALNKLGYKHELPAR